MPPHRPYLIGLAWTPKREEHVSRHIDPLLVDEMIVYGQWTVHENTEDHPPEHLIFVGLTESGLWITAVLREPDADEPGMWIPVTGWYSTETEKDKHASRSRYRQNR